MQSVGVNNSHSNKRKILHGVPQGLVLGFLLFNIDLTDLFLECKNDDFSSYVDDITPNSRAEDVFCNYRTSKYCQQSFQVV